MGKQLRRRSLQPGGTAVATPVIPATLTALIPPSEQTPQPAPSAHTPVPLSPVLLKKVPGIGDTVANRIVVLAPTVEALWSRWSTVGDFANEVKGLSSGGASKIFDLLREQFPNSAPSQGSSPPAAQTVSTAPPPVSPPPVQAAEEPKEEGPTALPNLYASFSPEQLEVLLPTIAGPERDAVERYLNSLKVFEAPILPSPYDTFNDSQLEVLMPTLAIPIQDQVRAYLAWKKSSPAAAGEPQQVQETPAPPSAAYGRQQTPAFTVNEALAVGSSSDTGLRGFFSQSTSPDVAVPPVATPSVPLAGVLGFFQQAANTYRTAGDRKKVNYVSMTGGRNVIRLLAGWKEGAPPFRSMRVHTWNENGRNQWGIDYAWLIKEEDLCRYLLENGQIEEHDLQAGREFGDPIQELAFRLKHAGRDEEARSFWARTRYLWNVVNRASGNVEVYESSKTFFEQIALFQDGTLIGGLLSVYPDLFDAVNGRDIQINGNGQDGKLRRYAAPIALDVSPSGVGPRPATATDLDGVVARKVVPWNKKAEVVFSRSGSLAASVGMIPQDWLGAADRFRS